MHRLERDAPSPRSVQDGVQGFGVEAALQLRLDGLGLGLVAALADLLVGWSEFELDLAQCVR